MKELKLSPDCIVTNGYLMTTIMDLRRQTYYTIPTQSNFIEEAELRSNLVTEEILLDLENTELLQLYGKYETPSVFDILLIENFFDNHVIIEVVEKFFINRIGFVLAISSIERFEETVRQLIQFDIEIIEVFIDIQTSDEVAIEKITSLINEFPVLFFNIFTVSQPELFDNLNQVRVINEMFTYSWRQSVNSFFVNFDFYFEALASNISFNKRLFLDDTGTFFESFHRKINLGSDCRQIEIDSLQEIWKTNKSNFDVCKSCEFRFMCLDFRYPIKRNENSWYYEEECKYNPFISKWSHEEGYRTLSEVGIVSNENEFSIDFARIEEINQELWT